jgi:hypothetical protein
LPVKDDRGGSRTWSIGEISERRNSAGAQTHIQRIIAHRAFDMQCQLEAATTGGL